MAVKQEPQQMSDLGDQEDGYEVLASNEYTGVDPRSDRYELSSYILQLHNRTGKLGSRGANVRRQMARESSGVRGRSATTGPGGSSATSCSAGARPFFPSYLLL